MSRISLLTLVGTLLLTPVVAQAEVIPLLKNLSTGNAVLLDDFEGVAVGAAPVAVTGTWTVTTLETVAKAEVTDFATSGILPHEGNQFLYTYGGDSNSDFVLEGVGAATGATDTIEMQIAFNQTSGGMVGVYLYDNSGDSLLLLGLAGSHKNWTTEVIYHDGSWNGTDLTYAQNTWNTLQVTHENGTTAWAISLNGGTPVNVSAAAGSTGAWNQIVIRRSVDAVTTYFDAVPEPGTMALLATGLIGLLCYAWRKRK